MTTSMTWLALALVALGTWSTAPRAAAEPAGKPARARTALSQALPPLDGRHLKATIAEVTYEPGGSSAAHSHPCPVLVYVIEGAIRTRVKGEREMTYRAGDTFFEAANGVHELSANASDQAPAKFVAIFVCDRDTPLSVSAAPAGGQ